MLERLVQTFRCARCGGEERFEPRSHAMRCYDCGGSRPVAPAARVDLRRRFTPTRALLAEEASADRRESAVTCQGCGATLAIPLQHATMTCPFCVRPMVLLPLQPPAHVAPVAMLPFRVPEQAARDSVQRWIAQLRMRPGAFRASARVAAVRGVYVPFRLFRLEYASHGAPSAHAAWRTREGGRHMSTTIGASRGLLPGLVDRILPQEREMVEVQAELLAGFPAELPTLPLADSIGRAHFEAEVKERDQFRHELGLDRGLGSDGGLRVHLEVHREDSVLVLAPVYVAAYRYGGRLHQVSRRRLRRQGRRVGAVLRGEALLLDRARPDAGPRDRHRSCGARVFGYRRLRLRGDAAPREARRATRGDRGAQRSGARQPAAHLTGLFV